MLNELERTMQEPGEHQQRENIKKNQSEQTHAINEMENTQEGVSSRSVGLQFTHINGLRRQGIKQMTGQ